MKKLKIWLIISIILILLILIVWYVASKKEENSISKYFKASDVVVINENKTISKINKQLNIKYKNINTHKLNNLEKDYLKQELKLKLEPSIVLTKNKNDQLVELEEINILDFYVKNNITTKDNIYSLYLKDIDMSNKILVLSNEHTTNDYLDIIEKYTTKYNLTNQIFNYSLFDKTKQQLLCDYLKLNRGYGEVALLILNNKNVISKLEGIKSEEEIKNYLIKESLIVIKEDTPNKPIVNPPTTPPIIPPVIPVVGGLKYLEGQAYLNKLNSKEKLIIVGGQPRCGFCQAAIPVLDAIGKEYNIEIFYVDLSLQTNKDVFFNSVSNMKTYFGTPYTMIVSNKSLVDSIEQKYRKEDYIEIFKRNALIN